MAYNYRDSVTGIVYAPTDDEHTAYFEEWARFDRTDDAATPLPHPHHPGYGQAVAVEDVTAETAVSTRKAKAAAGEGGE